MAARLVKELDAFVKGANAPYTAEAQQDVNHWLVTLPGPAGSAYEGGVFKLQFVFEGYPFKAPKVSFVTKIFHPSVTDDGHICIPVLETENWSPQTRVTNILAAFTAILSDPPKDASANPDVAAVLTTDPAKFKQTAQEWVKKYAM